MTHLLILHNYSMPESLYVTEQIIKKKSAGVKIYATKKVTYMWRYANLQYAHLN